MGVSLYMMTGFAIDQPSRPVIVSGVVQGLGLGLIFVPLQTLAFETLAARMRTTGGRAAQPVAQHRRLDRHLGRQHAARADDPGRRTPTCAAQITQSTIPTADPTILQTAIPVAGPAALAYINAMITKQALFIAYLDDFKLMMIVTFAVAAAAASS